MTIYLVRHGQTKSNELETFNMIPDEPISEKGYADLLHKKPLYDGVKFDYGYCSSMRRAQQTFEILFPDKKIDELRDDIVEIDLGDWAKQNLRAIFEEYIAEGNSLEEFPEPPNGETYENLCKRTKAFIEEVMQKRGDNQQIIVVAHGMVIASIIMQLDFFKDKSVLELVPDNGLGYIIEASNQKVTNITTVKS